MKHINILILLIFSSLFLFVSCEKEEIDNNETKIPGDNRPSDDFLISRGWVSYKDFGAKADGKSDDVMPMSRAHKFANENNLIVKIEGSDSYYIGERNLTIDIQTDTDFGSAIFIIDDTKVEDRSANVFSVNSSLKARKITSVSSLKKNQSKIDGLESEAGLLVAIDSNVKRYIRYGVNQNNGSDQTDVFSVNKDGEVDSSTPILWDFNQITNLTFYPMDETILTVKGGRFRTIANNEKSEGKYFKRGLAIRRSNVVVDGIMHYVTGEGEMGAPYNGFIDIANSASITIKNSTLTGRKKYATGAGTYDIILARTVNVTFENCKQTNDINNRDYWGIMGSNYCKNITLDNCEFSRFDAHQGVANATVKNSKLGHQGINAIGSGTFLVENTTVSSNNFINLRSDYGSTWEGEFIIKNSTFKPSGVRSGNVNIIGGENLGKHNFGYDCYMPERITFDNFKVNDSDHPANYKGVAIFANFNGNMYDDTYVEDYTFFRTKEVILKGVQTASGIDLRISDNTFMFKDVVITK